MREHTLAFWLLRRSLPKSHAESLLGDLLESCDADAAGFRRLLTRTLWSLHWRSFAGVGVAAVLGGIALSQLQVAFFEAFWTHQGNPAQQALGSTLAATAGLLIFMACFCAVRFGLSDRLTQLSAGLGLCGALASSFLWVHGVAVTSAIFAVGLIAACLCGSKGRPAVKAFASLIALQPLLWVGGFTAFMTPLSTVLKHTHADLETVKPLLIAYLACAYGALALASCWICSRIHRWAFRPAV